MDPINAFGRLAKHAIVPTALALTGCGQPPEGTEKLDDEQYEKVEYLVGIAKEATPMVKEIVHAMDGGWVDAHGATDSPDAMITAIDEAQETLDYYWANDRFYVGPTSTMYAGDVNAVGFHSPVDTTPEDRSDNYIVLNSDYEDAWTAELIVHECTHALMYHDITIEEELLAVDNQTYANPEIAKIIHKHNDIAYMQSGLYVGPSNLLVSLDQHRHNALAEAHALVDAGEPREAIEQLKENLAMGDKDAWVVDKAEWITDWTVFYAEFGVSTEELADSLAEAGVYETEMKKRTEMIEELTKEIQEHRREAVKELRTPPIDWKLS
jgi:hypothetical protein